MVATPPPSSTADALRALSRLLARVTADASHEGIAAALAPGLVEEFGAALARVWLYDPADDALHLRATAGLTAHFPNLRIRIPLASAQPPIAEALLARERIVGIISAFARALAARCRARARHPCTPD